jgi:hypothetical protein
MFRFSISKVNGYLSENIIDCFTLDKKLNMCYILKNISNGHTSFFLPSGYDYTPINKISKHEFEIFLTWLKNQKMRVQLNNRNIKKCQYDHLEIEDCPHAFYKKDKKKYVFECVDCNQFIRADILLTLTKETQLDIPKELEQ